MHREGHLGVSLLLYSPVTYLLISNDLMTVFGMGLVAMGFWSFAPDLDLELPIPHRGPTHSFVAAIVAGLLTAIIAFYLAYTGDYGSDAFVIEPPIFAYLGAIGFGFGIGVLGVVSHLLGDAITPMRIRPWWPISDREHGIPLVYASDKRANEMLSLAGGLAMTAAFVVATI